MTENKENFLGLTLNEASNKLASFIDSGRTIRMWEKGESPELVLVTSLSSNNLIVDVKVDAESWDLKKILLNFSFNNVDYFCKGIVTDVVSNSVTLKLDQDVFKSEKRQNERLLTFPHHQAYAYFKVSSFNLDKDNVIAFQKNVDDKKIYEEFLSDKQKHQSLDGDISELMGFRILDLSATGISFSANNQETQFFASLEDNKGIAFTLMFDGDSYSCGNGNVIYIVDFVNPRASSVPMKKIGIQFNVHPELKNKIQEIISQSCDSLESEKDFESFLES